MTKYKQTLAPAQPEPRRCWAEMSHRPSGFQLYNGSSIKILVLVLYMVIVAIVIIIVILKAKLHYLKIISELPSYGAKCFSTTLNSVSSSSRHHPHHTRVWSVIHFPHFPIFLWNPFFSFFLLNLSWITVSAWIRTFPPNFWFFWQRHHHCHPDNFHKI